MTVDRRTRVDGTVTTTDPSDCFADVLPAAFAEHGESRLFSGERNVSGLPSRVVTQAECLNRCKKFAFHRRENIADDR